MITNSDATLYRRKYNVAINGDEWERVYIPDLWWYAEEDSVVTTDGLKSVNKYTVRIPDTDIQMKKDDYLVKGNADVMMETISDLKGLHFFKVISANYADYGENPHILVGGV